MKQISDELKAHLAQEVTTLATCWKLTRRDSTVFAFTDHDSDIEYESLLYKASTGFTPSAVQNSGSLSVDNLDVEGMLADDSIMEVDILAGLYDFAEIEIFQVNYNDLTQGCLQLRRGWLGEVAFQKQQFIAEVRGLTQKMSQTVGELFSASCRASFGDSRCKINLASHTVTGTVSGSSSQLQFIDEDRSEVSGVFSQGAVTFTSGANAGLGMEVKEYLYNSATGGQIVFALPVPYPISVGDTYSLVKGCDKTISTCHGTYNNVVNFRGEPLIPGIDRMLETAGTRSNW